MALTQISTQGIKDGTITGSDLATNVDLVDNQTLRIGTGNDLQIFHNGTDSFIQNYSGDFNIRGVDGKWILIQAKPNENSIICKEDGAVELYYDNVKKLETTSAGATLTGNFNLTGSMSMAAGKYINGTGGLDLYGDSNDGPGDLIQLIDGGIKLQDNKKIEFGSSNDLQIYHDGTHSYISEIGTGELRITTDSAVHIRKHNNENIAKFTANGSVELYHDNSKKLETTADGISIVDKVIKFQGQSNRLIKFRDGENDMIYECDSGDFYRQDIGNSAHEFFTGNNKRLTIDSSGNIGAPSGTNIFNASDSRVKTNVVDLDKGLSAIKSLRPVSFNWIDGFCDTEKNTLYGFIAQEVKAVDSNLIQDFATELIIDNNKIENVLRVNEKFIIPMLVKAIQELSAKVAALEAA